MSCLALSFSDSAMDYIEEDGRNLSCATGLTEKEQVIAEDVQFWIGTVCKLTIASIGIAANSVRDKTKANHILGNPTPKI